ncbi:MAG: hypothetical protein VR72_11260 [Clostridiaceae bacterium BRH_c20a]|nr:MAG: hypothetical protein VR72_11260 [Clostridiaceae bacterium BRH_c20a]
MVEQLSEGSKIIEITQKILGIPSPQAELFENEPMVQEFIKNIVKPYVEELGLLVRLDARGNFILCLRRS